MKNLDALCQPSCDSPVFVSQEFDRRGQAFLFQTVTETIQSVQSVALQTEGDQQTSDGVKRKKNACTTSQNV